MPEPYKTGSASEPGSDPSKKIPTLSQERWEKDRAAARSMGRGIRRSRPAANADPTGSESSVEQPPMPVPPSTVAPGEDLGVSSVTVEFSADMVRQEAQRRAQNAGTAEEPKSPEPQVEEATNATLLLDAESLRQTLQPQAQASTTLKATHRPHLPAARRHQRRTTVKSAPRQASTLQTTSPPSAPTVRTRSEAEAELYQSVHDDHLFLNNPIMVRGLGLAPAIVAAVNGHTAALLSVAAALLLTGTRVLAVSLCHLLGHRQRPLLYLFSAALLYIPTYCLLNQLFGSELAVLGIYLPLLVTDPLVIKRMEAPDLESVREAFGRGINNALGATLSLLLIGSARELLGAGSIFGITVLSAAPLPLAVQPAGGFLFVGLLAAVWTALGGAYVHYKREEVRYLYVDRKL